MAEKTFDEQVQDFTDRLQTMQGQNYKAFIFALIACEDRTISDERYDEWYNSDFPLLDEALT
ncbi:hypothetical protein [Lacticaseibacillus sharpeae]|jgi:hypothetical protein|uniref:hypothetical protein n=1 Tax=Lacticaseibacillus sharpeae TaxID=1626 RepID=UPI0006D1D687|nr:hypothetical protein [Lacticaseibacillus sharpeae]